MKTTDEGIFLYRKPYSSSSLITWFFTRQNGLQKFAFRGGKKKSHQIFPLAISELTFYKRSNVELLNLTSCDTVLPLTFQFNPIKSSVAFFIAEVIRKSVHTDDTDEELYLFLRNEILKLEASENLSMFPIRFLIEFSSFLGIIPQIEDENPDSFDLNSGQFICAHHVAANLIQGDVVDLLYNLISKEGDQSFSNKTRTESLDTMLLYFSIHIPGFNKLESFDIIKDILHD